MSAPLELQFVDEAVERLGRGPEALIPILHALQDHYGYLPEEALRKVCQTTQITPASAAGVSSFYDAFRLEPAGKHIVRICRGTACHVSGAERVEETLRRHLRIPHGKDTDPQRQFTIEQVACLGCCTLAPVLKLDEATVGHVRAEKAPGILRDLVRRKDGAAPSTEELRSRTPGLPVIRVGLGSCCMAKGSDRLFEALQARAAESGTPVEVKRVGCVGMCHRTPMIEVVTPGKPAAFYAGLDPFQASGVLDRHFPARGFARTATRLWTRALEGLLLDNPPVEISSCALEPSQPEVAAFLDRQVHIATERFGEADPLDLEEYVEHGGFSALARCLGTDLQPHVAGADPARNGGLDSQAICGLIKASGLRGRGGAGFPTGEKWELALRQQAPAKYVICNGDEGDPGAFMDRMLLESFPYRIIEGLAIAALAVGAQEGFLYIRHEYPLAVQRVRAALKLCRNRGWLGDKLLGTARPLRLSVVEGGGAFVCGEETALIASIEGRRGMPRLRPPYPAIEGLWGRPTVINNVETLALVPWIIRQGPGAFAAYGTTASKGTKVFALAGNVQRGGLIEVPMGMTIREIVEGIGGGVRPGRKFKAVQIGGPSGGCVPERLADTAVDFESLRKVGAIMGSGGLVVLDDSACMVDIARYFLHFTQAQSCGKCTFCRVGTRRMLDILERLCAGKGRRQDLDELDHLSRQVAGGSLCGLGKTAPNPVLTTLRYFREEYEAHIEGRCPAAKCAPLIRYRVLDNCTGCTLCAQHCPADAIPMTPYARHEINLDKCTRCDSCRQVCPYNAIEVK